MHSKAIEAAARAIDRALAWDVESVDARATELTREEQTKVAQACIAAYHAAMEAEVPTEAMIDAGVEVAGMPIASVVPQGEDADRYMVRLIWQHMLSARPNVKG